MAFQLNDLESVANGSERIAQLVCQDGKEIVLLFPLARQLLGALVQRFFQTLVLGAVAEDLGEAAEPAFLVAQRRGDAVDPQTGAALIHQPAVIVGAS